LLFRRVLLLFLVSFLGVAQAMDNHPEVLRIEPRLEEGWLQIDADVRLPVSDDLRHFAERGVALYFTADMEIVRPRRWWFDSEVVSTQQTWRVTYNALTRQWRIGTGRSEEHTSELQSRENLVCRLPRERKDRPGRAGE